MRVFVSLLPSVPAPEIPAEAPVVVIDVLRATTVMAVALAAGARRIVASGEIETARQLARDGSSDPAGMLLCGERQCRPIDGFALGNSPAEYTARVVGGRTLVMTTTNGTRALLAAAEAPRVMAGSLVNLGAVVERLAGASEVHLLCAGTDGRVTGEDVLAAGAIFDRCASRYGATAACDETSLARAWWRSVAGTPAADIAAALAKTRGGRNLVQAGYAADLNVCAAVDSIDIVPELTQRDPLTLEVVP